MVNFDNTTQIILIEPANMTTDHPPIITFFLYLYQQDPWSNEGVGLPIRVDLTAYYNKLHGLGIWAPVAMDPDQLKEFVNHKPLFTEAQVTVNHTFEEGGDLSLNYKSLAIFDVDSEIAIEFDGDASKL